MQSSNTIETNDFWQNHYDTLRVSGLSRKDYCCQNELSYDRFGYWISKKNKINKTKLIPVQLKPENTNNQMKILATLSLKNNRQLKIHDQNSLIFILEKFG